MEFLLERDVHLDIADMMGVTARDIARQVADPEILQLLQDPGSSPEGSYTNGIIIDTSKMRICHDKAEVF